MSESYDFLFKFLVIGSAGTGKSCLLHQFMEGKYKADSNHTIGVEFGSRIVSVGGKMVKLQIWDTAGQERFRSVTRSYYRGAAGALLVYDISNRESYNALANWLADARTLASPNIVVLCVGNKRDLDAEREVTFMEASQFAQENGCALVLFEPLSCRSVCVECREPPLALTCTTGPVWTSYHCLTWICVPAPHGWHL
ncbi:Small GTP-binding protein domain [Trinorchestia longiramus]|nr:Small GTP-binding protein domain [Trinorchestia longiramus]